MQAPVLQPVFTLHNHLCCVAHCLSTLPPVRSYFCWVIWEQSLGAVCTPSLSTQPREPRSWVCALWWRAETTISMQTGATKPSLGLFSRDLEMLSAFWEMVAYPDESLTLSSSFSVHVLLSMPTPQRWVLDFLHPDIHAYLLGMAVFPSLACSCCSYSPGFLTPGEQAVGQPGYEWMCEPCVCADSKFCSAAHLTDPKLGSLSLEKNLSPFSHRRCILSQWLMKGVGGLWLGHAKGWSCQARCLGRKKKSRRAASRVGGSWLSYIPHLMCFLFILHTAISFAAEALRITVLPTYCSHCCENTAVSCHLQSSWACSIKAWRLQLPAWPSVSLHIMLVANQASHTCFVTLPVVLLGLGLDDLWPLPTQAVQWSYGSMILF